MEMASVRRLRFAALRRWALSSWELGQEFNPADQWLREFAVVRKRTSRIASFSFAPGSFFVEPFGLRITVVSVLYSAAKSGLFWRAASSTGGSILTRVVQ